MPSAHAQLASPGVHASGVGEQSQPLTSSIESANPAQPAIRERDDMVSTDRNLAELLPEAQRTGMTRWCTWGSAARSLTLAPPSSALVDPRRQNAWTAVPSSTLDAAPGAPRGHVGSSVAGFGHLPVMSGANICAGASASARRRKPEGVARAAERVGPASTKFGSDVDTTVGLPSGG